jgi:hypothetical protein
VTCREYPGYLLFGTRGETEEKEKEQGKRQGEARNISDGVCDYV